MLIVDRMLRFVVDSDYRTQIKQKQTVEKKVFKVSLVLVNVKRSTMYCISVKVHQKSIFIKPTGKPKNVPVRSPTKSSNRAYNKDLRQRLKRRLQRQFHQTLQKQQFHQNWQKKFLQHQRTDFRWKYYINLHKRNIFPAKWINFSWVVN